MIKKIFLIMAAVAMMCMGNAAQAGGGSLQVTIQPVSAVSQNAQWRRVGASTWRSSGETEANLAVGNYSVEFSALSGWRVPQTRTMTVTDGSVTATTGTYYDSSVTVADSQADFSLVQGSKGWYYGYRVYGSSAFNQFALTGTDGSYGSMWYQGGLSRLWAMGGHPEPAVQPVRRWVASMDSEATVSGTLRKLAGGGDGFIGAVQVNGVQPYATAIAGTDTTGVSYSFRTHIAPGTNVEFIIDANGNTDLDHCGFTGAVKVPVSTGSLNVAIQPAGAVAAGARWRRVGTTPWFANGETEYDIPAGSHSVEFGDATGWTPPSPRNVTIAANQTSELGGMYQLDGSLHVTIQPSEAIAEGAKWRRVGTSQWLASGDTELNVHVGSYEIEFSDITSLAKPATQTAAVASAQTCEVVGTYVPCGLLKVSILPALAVIHKAQWRRVGTTTWLSSGDSDKAPVGNCSIEFKKIQGWREPLTRTVAVVADQTTEPIGTYHGSAVVGWGSNDYGQCDAPSPNSEFVAVAGGQWFSVGLKSDGSVTQWGTANSGLPSPNSGFVAIACGGHAMGLKSNGSVVCWRSDNYYGQCNVPYPNSGFTAVAAGADHSMGLRSDGSIACWGSNQYGQCAVPYPNSGFTAVAAGQWHSLAVRADGSIVAWGFNNNGQCNVPSPNSGFTSVSGLMLTSVGLKTDGSIVGWGYNANGEANPPSLNSGLVSISGGAHHTVGLRSDGSVAAWGSSGSGECTVPSPNSGFLAIGAGNGFGLAIRSTGLGFLHVTIQPAGAIAAGAKWRRAGTSKWFSSGETEYDLPVGSYSVEFCDAGSWARPAVQTAIVAPDKTCEVVGAYLAPGSLHVTIQPAEAVASGAKWRRVGTSTWLSSDETESNIMVGSYSVELGPTTTWAPPSPRNVTITANQTSELVGTYLPGGSLKINILPVLAVSHSGQWRRVGTTIWHNNGDTEFLAAGDYGIEFKKIQGWREPMTRTVTVLADRIAEATGTYHGGAFVAWGRNDYGQCNPPSPNSEFVSVAGGACFSVGLRSDGSVAQWGATTGALPSPNSGFAAIACGEYHTLGLRSDGSVTCWGWNNSGQCNVPAPNSGFVAIDGGNDHSIGLRSDGSIAAWGYNALGQCNVPSLNSGFVSIAAGDEHCVAVKTDGSVLAWGWNASGQCTVPSPNTGFAKVSAGRYQTIGLKSDGSVVCWGDNGHGELTVPSPNSGFVSVGGRYYNSVGLRADGSIAAWGSNSKGQLGIPSPNSGFAAVDEGYEHTVAIRFIDLGSLRVTITPTEAAAGGKWRRVGTSTWFASGEIEYDVPVGSYSIELIDLAGWTKPSPIAVTTNSHLTDLTATYLPPAMTLPQAKTNPDGTAIRISGATVSAVWPDVFYIEAGDRTSGIRVEKPSHGLIYKNLADVVGIIGTNGNGERFIQASTAAKIGDGDVKPLGMTNKLVGGGNLLDSVTGSGQLGVLDGFGLNNIGLLVRTWGEVVETEQVTAPNLPTWFKIDDGGARIKCVVPSGVAINAGWNYVSVTGVSSCERASADSIVRLIRIRTINDITSD